VKRDSVLGRSEGKRPRELSVAGERVAKRRRFGDSEIEDDEKEEMEFDAAGDMAVGFKEDEYDDESVFPPEDYDECGMFPQEEEEEEEEEDDDIEHQDYTPAYTRTPSSRGRRSASYLEDEDNPSADMSFNTALRVTDDPLPTPPLRRLTTLPSTLYLPSEMSTATLVDQNWDTSYISLLQHIALRGREALLPHLLFLEYRYLPPVLFAPDNPSAYLTSLRGDHYRSGKALHALFDLGARVRDRASLHDPLLPPEPVVRKAVKAYMKWIYKDADFRPWPRSAIPLLVTVYASGDVPASAIRSRASEKCRRLARRWYEALRIHRSVEISPGSETTTTIYPMPTIFALVCSRTMVALMAFDPKRERGLDEEICTPMAYFDFAEGDYDVWNGLALGLVGCHVRNEMVLWREQCGIGERESGEARERREKDLDA
jgi:hypothetical protein